MNPTLSSLAKRCFQTVGHYARRLHDDAFPGVAVLCYHGVQADDWPPGLESGSSYRTAVSPGRVPTAPSGS